MQTVGLLPLSTAPLEGWLLYRPSGFAHALARLEMISDWLTLSRIVTPDIYQVNVHGKAVVSMTPLGVFQIGWIR